MKLFYYKVLSFILHNLNFIFRDSFPLICFFINKEVGIILLINLNVFGKANILG